MLTNFKDLELRLKNNTELYVGYPPNTDFDYSELWPLLKYSINNLGDCFDLHNPFSTHEYEKAVIEWFLALYGMNEGEGWGYVTNGGTEGNLFGLWNGRKLLNNPIVYYSKAAHYSVPKAIDILSLESRVIQADQKGILDYEHFSKILEPKRDAIFLATLGSTMTASLDNVNQIKGIFDASCCHYYIHADAAIDGMILPFIDDLQVPFKLSSGIDSLCISGHKIIGTPIPCGVLLTKDKVFGHLQEYVRNKDLTISGSRNGVTVLMLWYAIKKYGYQGFKDFIKGCLQKAKIYCAIFNENNIKAWRFDESISIVLEKMPDELMNKWHAPSAQYWTTLTALPKLNEQKVQEIIADYKHYQLHGHLPNFSKTTLMPSFNDEISLL